MSAHVRRRRPGPLTTGTVITVTAGRKSTPARLGRHLDRCPGTVCWVWRLIWLGPPAAGEVGHDDHDPTGRVADDSASPALASASASWKYSRIVRMVFSSFMYTPPQGAWTKRPRGPCTWK
jgi:hypothetical protein